MSQLKTELLDELVRQLHESALFLDHLRKDLVEKPCAFGLELVADRLRDLAGELTQNV